MKLLTDIPKEDLADKVVLLRAGLNLPLDDAGHVVDDFRIVKALPTIQYLAKHAKQLIVMAHLGRARDATLTSVAKELKKHVPELHFAQWSDGVQGRRVVLLENIRQDPREVSLEASDRASFARDVLTMTQADIFVQDAFSVCHRKHASIVSIPQLLPSYAGFLVEEEVIQLDKARSPSRPSLFVLGGAKFATKEPLIRKFLNLYDKIFIGGAIANEFFKARGYEVGHSLIHDGKIPHDILYNKNIILPETVRVSNDDGHIVYVRPQDVLPTMKIVDAVPTPDLFSHEYQFILWNGPLGFYEAGFIGGTDKILKMLEGAKKHNPNIQMMTGGGDTLATIGQERRNIFTHISAGGGAMLTYLQEGILPGVTVLG